MCEGGAIKVNEWWNNENKSLVERKEAAWERVLGAGDAHLRGSSGNV